MHLHPFLTAQIRAVKAVKNRQGGIYLPANIKLSTFEKGFFIKTRSDVMPLKWTRGLSRGGTLQPQCHLVMKAHCGLNEADLFWLCVFDT